MSAKFFAVRSKAILLAGGALVLPVSVAAQDQDAVSVAQQDAENTIIVSGFRASLNEAVETKREATGQVDVIVAEDIANFPDTNLAESLQRIPGVAIERDAGEGRQITVRGLGGQFTRVRVNGMETIATSVDGASFNRDRAFDFNVFASELFNSIVVHKTASASLSEGSLGAVIDLNTGNPLAFGAGTRLVGSAQARYNDLNDDLSPRLAGLFAWNNQSETFGFSLSAAWSAYETAELGNNTVRWANNATFRSVDGVDCAANPADPGCAEVTAAFHPRIPRYGLVNHDRERLGLTGAVEFRPNDNTHFQVSGLYSNFSEDRDEYWGEVLLRSNERNIDLSNYTIDSNNNVIRADLTNAWIRNERYHRESETEFYQVSATLDQRIGDSITATLLAGISQSDARIPVETTIIFDDRDGSYSYDYTNMAFPLLVFNTDVTNPANFQLAEFRDRPSRVQNDFKTVSLDLVWEASDSISLSGGPFYREFEFFTTSARRDSTYCSAFDCAPDAYGAPVTADLAELFVLGDAGQPAGNTNSWIVPDLAASVAFLDLYNRPAVLRQGDERGVTEEVTGAYGQLDFEFDPGVRINGNIGLRYANTDQTSRGFVSGQYVSVERSYDDWLPSANINIEPFDDFLVRGAVAKVITRPTLGNLTPGGSIDEFNFRISSGNPFIEPYRAWNYDLSLEYYFAPGAIVSIAGFIKDISSFPVGSSLQVTYAQSGLPTSLLTPGTPAYVAVVDGADPNREFEFRTTTNGEGATIKGVEIGLNLPFSAFADGPLSDFGVLGNMTFVDSKQDVNFGGQLIEATFPGVSDFSANGTVYYDNGRFSIRISGAYRSDYNTGNSGNGNFLQGFDSSFNLDAAIRYSLTDRIELTLDANNLTDEYRYRWTDNTARRNYENNHFGRIVMAGVRIEM